MAKFRALLVTKNGDRQSLAVTELTDANLMEGDVTVAVEHSMVNYKDGLAITGKAPIIRNVSANTQTGRRALAASGRSANSAPFAHGPSIWRSRPALYRML